MKVSAQNGGDVSLNPESRLVMARRYREIASAVLADQGGADQCSESRRQLIKRFATAAVLGEKLAAKVARGEEININEYTSVCGTLVRLARILGLDRTTRSLTPTLADILQSEEWE